MALKVLYYKMLFINNLMLRWFKTIKSYFNFGGDLGNYIKDYVGMLEKIDNTSTRTVLIEKIIIK